MIALMERPRLVVRGQRPLDNDQPDLHLLNGDGSSVVVLSAGSTAGTPADGGIPADRARLPLGAAPILGTPD